MDLIKKEYHLFSTIVSNMDLGLLIMDMSLPNYPIVFANRGFAKLFGHQPDEIIGSGFYHVINLDDQPICKHEFEEVLTERTTATLDFVYRRADGQDFVCELKIDFVD